MVNPCNPGTQRLRREFSQRPPMQLIAVFVFAFIAAQRFPCSPSCDTQIWLASTMPAGFLRTEGPLVEPSDPIIRIDLLPGGAGQQNLSPKNPSVIPKRNKAIHRVRSVQEDQASLA